MTQLEPRLTPSTPWSAGWPESLRVYGHGIDDAVQVRVWVEDAAIAERVAELIAPVESLTVVTTKPSTLPGRFIAVRTAGEWLYEQGAVGRVGNVLGNPWATEADPVEVFVLGSGIGGFSDTIRGNVAAHEVMHGVRVDQHSDDPRDLMFHTASYEYSTRLHRDEINRANDTVKGFLANVNQPL